PVTHLAPLPDRGNNRQSVASVRSTHPVLVDQLSNQFLSHAASNCAWSAVSSVYCSATSRACVVSAVRNLIGNHDFRSRPAFVTPCALRLFAEGRSRAWRLRVSLRRLAFRSRSFRSGCFVHRQLIVRLGHGRGASS